MRLIGLAILYTALALGANPARAVDLAPLLAGDMRKLVPAPDPQLSPPQPFPPQTFTGQLLDAAEAPVDLARYRGKWLLVNFWATWCAPCRHEMPALNALSRDFGGADFAVLTIATGRNPLPAITKFYDEAGVTDLPVLRDPRQDLARASGVLGLPATLLIDPEGREIARMQGDADWAGPEARALIAALLGRAGPNP